MQCPMASHRVQTVQMLFPSLLRRLLHCGSAALASQPALHHHVSVPHYFVMRRLLASRPNHSSDVRELSAKVCWGCGQPFAHTSFVCSGCDTIQPIGADISYFELLGVPNQLDIDIPQLERRYKALQWQLHPDKVVNRPVREQELAAQQAALINHAYSVLKSPLLRANYLLSQRGYDAPEEFEGTISDPSILMEVLELREEVESTADPQRLKALLQQNQAQQQSVLKELSRAFDNLPAQKDEATSLATQLKYLTRLEEEIVRKLPHG